MKRFLRAAVEIAGALLVMVMLILWMSGFFAEKIAPGVVPVRAASAPEGAPAAVVEEGVLAVVEEATGTVQAERKTLVSSRILASIASVAVRAGDQVDEGDVLVVLDSRELEARAAEAARAQEGAAAARQKAESDLSRARSLLAGRIISSSEFDQTQAAFKIADAAFERARQALQAAEVNLSYAEIRAPVAGRVVDRFADPGDTAVPGKPLLSLYDPAALRIEAPVREALVSRLHIGDRVSVRLGSEGTPMEGVVDEVVPQAEAGSRTFLVKVGLPRTHGIYTGMFGRVLIPAGERRRVLVAEAAIERIGQLHFASVVDDQRRVTRRLVTLGAPSGDGRIEVLSGLEPGETVLLPPR
jgi:membrane fusion protein (multidrug efflux system)